MQETLRYTGDEEAQRGEILRKNTRPFPKCCGLPMVFDNFDAFNKPLRPHFYCKSCRNEKLPDFWPPAPYLFGDMQVCLAYNRSVAFLREAVWIPYPVNHKYNPEKDNGFMCGTVVEGETYNRLFHATSTTVWKRNVPYRMDYVALKHIRGPSHSRENTIVFEHHNCG